MDARILFVIVAVLLVYWLNRSRFSWHSQSSDPSGAPKHPQRRFSDRTLSGRQLQRSCEASDQEPEMTVTTPAGSSIAADTHVASSANHLFQSTAPTGTYSGEGSEAETLQTPSGTAATTPSHEPVGSLDMQSEVDRLTELVQQRDRRLTRDRHAMEEVEKLRKKLFGKERELEMLKQACARSDAALAHYRSGAQRAAMFEQQLAEARELSEAQEQELEKLRARQGVRSSLSGAASIAHTGSTMAGSNVSDQTRRKNQRHKEHLSSELRDVETRAEQASQSSVELRRIRGELETVRSDSANAKNRISELQERVREQQVALETARSTARPSAEITVLKQTLLNRQQQNEELKRQLAGLSGSSSMPSADKASDDREASGKDKDRG